MQQSYKNIRAGAFSLESLPIFPEKESCGPAVERLAEHLQTEVQRCKLTGQSPSLHRAMFRWWKGFFVQEALRAVLFSCLFVLTPFLLQQTIRCLRTGDHREAMLWLAALPLSGMLGGLVQQHGFHACTLFGRQTWAGLVGNIFRKLTTLDTSASKVTEGEIVSMIGQDASIWPYMSPFLSIFSAIPGNLLLPGTILAFFLGRAFFAGLAACILLVILSNCAAAKYKQKVQEKLRVADERLALINETLQGARSVKLCAWECALEEKINKVREKEITVLSWIHLAYALQQGAVSALPVVGISTALLTYTALGSSLEADVVAMTVAYFDYLALGFQMLPNCKMQLQIMSAGLSRVERLLLRPDVRDITSQADAVPGISMANASFSWSDSAVLSNVALSVPPGRLVLVVGPVASGKSTLLSGLFGFAQRSCGSSSLRGQPAYVPQNPQVLNASVCDNILFGAAWEPSLYKAALTACCLEQDMEQLVDGDATEIGEKGITISGGQRARIAMARAFYANPDVVVMDDPLSAMDAHVGAKVFQSCIMALRSSGKAVLMTTNQLHFCAAADEIIILKQGEVAHRGSFEEVKDILVTCGMSSQVSEDAAPKRATGDSRCGVARGMSEATLGKARKQQRLTSGMTTEAVVQGRLTLSAWLSVSAGSGAAGKTLGLALLGLCLLTPVAMYLSNILLAQWTSEQDSDQMVYYAVASLVFAACCGLRVVFAALYFTELSRKLHKQMLASVLRQSMAWYDTTPLGRVLNRFSQDMALVDLQMPRIYEFTMQHFTIVVLGTFGASMLAWPVLLLLLLVAFPLFILQSRYNAVALNLQRLMLMATSPVMSQVSSFLIARDTIRAFRRENFFVSDFIRSMDDFYKSYYWIHSLDRLCMSIFSVFFVPFLMLSLGAAVLSLVALEMLTPELGGMALALSIGLAQRLVLYLWCWSTFEKFFGAAQRIAEYAALKWEGSQKDHDDWKKAYDQPSLTDQGQLALVMKDVSLRYQPGLPLVLNSLTLTVRAGERMGICGRTGSGKSTLFLACFRLVEMDAGEIEIWGRSVTSLTLPELRSNLAIVPQDPLMFSGTLRFNLDFQGHHSDEEIWAALRLARLDGLVMDMPLKLDEPVEEKGSNFSAGTVQLICIARILMAHQRIVFLDECTANVDMNTDSEVQKAVRSACQDCAVICIAHRLQTIMDYDQLAVLDKGKVVEFGPPQDLLRSDGAFSALASSSGDKSRVHEENEKTFFSL